MIVQQQKKIARLNDDVSKLKQENELLLKKVELLSSSTDKSKEQLELERKKLQEDCLAKIKAIESEYEKLNQDRLMLKKLVEKLEIQIKDLTDEKNKLQFKLNKQLSFFQDQNSKLTDRLSTPQSTPVSSLTFNVAGGGSSIVQHQQQNVNVSVQVQNIINQIIKEFDEAREVIVNKLEEQRNDKIKDEDSKVYDDYVKQLQAFERLAFTEKRYIKDRPVFKEFYDMFQLLLSDALLACHVIHSGMVNQSADTKDHIAEALKEGGKHVPVFGIVLTIIGYVVQYSNKLDKKQAVNRAAQLVSQSDIGKFSEALARGLTGSLTEKLEEIAKKKPGFIARGIKAFGKIKDSLTGNDVDTDIKELAQKYFKELLIKIFEGEIRPIDVII